MTLQTPLMLPVFMDTEESMECDRLEVPYYLEDLNEVRNYKFYSVDSIGPYKDRGTKKDGTRLYTVLRSGGSSYVVALEPPQVSKLIEQCRTKPRLSQSYEDTIKDITP